jgi:hypothetical protein
MRDRLLELLRARPFVPFRMELSSGTIHVIRHPDQVIMMDVMAFVGVPKDDAPGSGPYYADVAIVSLAHVTQLEVLRPASSPG